MTDWTDPTTQAKGFFVDAATYNAHIINNLKHLYERPYPQCVGYEAISNTVTETAMGVYTIPADALGINGMIYAEWWFAGVADAARTTTFAPYIGATQLFTDTVITAGAANFMACVRCWVANTGATNTQLCIGDWLNALDVTEALADFWDEVSGWFKTAAIDTTAEWTLSVHVTMGAAAAGYSVALAGSNLVGPFLVAS
jgi:hypothetical protein